MTSSTRLCFSICFFLPFFCGFLTASLISEISSSHICIALPIYSYSGSDSSRNAFYMRAIKFHKVSHTHTRTTGRMNMTACAGGMWRHHRHSALSALSCSLAHETRMKECQGISVGLLHSLSLSHSASLCLSVCAVAAASDAWNFIKRVN